MSNFKGRPISVLFSSMGFKEFGPGHSAKSGYEMKIGEDRIVRFYDNRIWGQNDIEFEVISKSNGNWSSFRIYFERELFLTGEVINALLEIAKESNKSNDEQCVFDYQSTHS